MSASAAANRRSIWFTGEEHINSLTLRKGQDLKRGPALFYPEIVSAVLEKRTEERARRFTGIHEEVSSVRWMDNGEELSFEQDCDAGILTVNASGFSYGDNYVVRVAEVRQVSREKNPH